MRGPLLSWLCFLWHDIRQPSESRRSLCITPCVVGDEAVDRCRSRTYRSAQRRAWCRRQDCRRHGDLHHGCSSSLPSICVAQNITSEHGDAMHMVGRRAGIESYSRGRDGCRGLHHKRPFHLGCKKAPACRSNAHRQMVTQLERRRMSMTGSDCWALRDRTERLRRIRPAVCGTSGRRCWRRHGRPAHLQSYDSRIRAHREKNRLLDLRTLERWHQRDTPPAGMGRRTVVPRG